MLTKSDTELLTLSEQTAFARNQGSHIVAYPYHWQEPAATEKTAYEMVVSQPLEGRQYWGFPWATIIDGLDRGAQKTWELLAQLQYAISRAGKPVHPRVTVAQHIYADRHIPLFAAAGITDILWTHAIVGQEEIDGIRIHPFPLYPAQAPQLVLGEAVKEPRPYLANFIGSYNPKAYITDVRAAIFDLNNTFDDLLIVKRDAWHFDRAVYQEQLGEMAATDQERLTEKKMAEEYLSGIRKSWFTLCPTGSGPNSIRIFESLALGSIPVILTKSLRLPGDRALWEQAAVFADDSRSGLELAIERVRELPIDERWNMIAAGRLLFEQVGPSGYRALIDSQTALSSITASQ